jgi:hypothetical protein
MHRFPHQVGSIQSALSGLFGDESENQWSRRPRRAFIHDADGEFMSFSIIHEAKSEIHWGKFIGEFIN